MVRSWPSPPEEVGSSHLLENLETFDVDVWENPGEHEQKSHGKNEKEEVNDMISILIYL